MIIAIPKEILPGENRVAATPATVKELIQKGLSVQVQSEAGLGSYFSDEKYMAASAEIVNDIEKLFHTADLVMKVNSPLFNPDLEKHEADMLKEGATFVSLFQTTKELEAVRKLRDLKITAFSMHLIPRTSLAKKWML